ncbi:MAG: hypothetical protein IKR48_06880 [Kiritimatiellae bacterium]|nr:hypothetical protein [Kiritimatiellia bacterium]
MSSPPKNLTWIEPWEWNWSKEKIAERKKELPPFWKCIAYSNIILLVLLGGLCLVRYFLPDLPGWKDLVGDRSVIIGIVGINVLLVLLPILVGIFPDEVYLSRTWWRIGGCEFNTNKITEISFEESEGHSFFVVHVMGRKGELVVCRALIPKKENIRQRIVSFLCDQGLAHLYNGGTDEGKTS